MTILIAVVLDLMILISYSSSQTAALCAAIILAGGLAGYRGGD